MDRKIKTTMKNLEKNNMSSYFVQNKKEALAKLLELVSSGSTIGHGGSKTLEEIDAFRILEKNNCRILKMYGKTKEESLKLRKEIFFCDVFLSSSNAITKDGTLINVDKTGNRIAAITFGPKKVIIISGKNKIVKDEKEAIERIRNIVAPLNAKRLGIKTPCTFTGKCMDCASPKRICCTKIVHGWQNTKGRISIIIVDEKLGY
jgi:L-lactate utilization protein LutB